MSRVERFGRRQPQGGRGGHRSAGRGGGGRGRVSPSDARHTLATLLDELSGRASAGESQETLIEWLYGVTSGLGIRMRYDEHCADDAPDDVADAADAAPGADDDAADAADAAPDADDDAADVAPDAADTNVASATAKRASSRRGERMQYSYDHGKLIVHFTDPALQEREPPRDGRFNHLSETDAFVGRIILSCDRRNARVNSPLCAECNGAVIDALTWKPLVIPSRAFAPRPAAREVNRGLAAAGADGTITTGHYDIIQVSDGTVVNLYRWKHPVKGFIWCLASSNGYDVSQLKWMGDKTYAELVFDLLSKHPGMAEESGLSLLRDHLCEGDVRLNFTKLDPGRCYTIGFRHPNFHPMEKDPPGVWNIQSANLDTGDLHYNNSEDSVEGLPHIPRQALYTREDIIRLATAGKRLGVGADGSALQLADFVHISRTAFEDAKAVIAGKAPTVPPLPEKSGVRVCLFNYGFILRSRAPDATGAYSDILFESSLLQRVRQLVYQRPTRQIREELNEGSRLEYNAIKAYLMTTDRDDFLALFPEFKEHFERYAAFIDNVVHMVIHMHRQNSMAPTSRSNDDAPRTQTKTVARAMLAHILQHESDFKAFHKDAKAIVYDFVARPEYAVLYLRAIGRSSDEK